MDYGIHLPLIEFEHEGLSRSRLDGAVDAARDAGFAAISANDHFLFGSPWLDGPTALAAAIERSEPMQLATTIWLAALRTPVPTAKALAAIDLLSGGRLVAGLGPGSSERDYEALGIPFGERWKRLDESIAAIRGLLGGETPGAPGGFYAAPDAPLVPPPARPGGVPLWIGSWGSTPGLRRVARLGDGWLASAYNTDPETFAQGLRRLRGQLAREGREPDGFPTGLASMWTWVTDSRADADRVLTEVMGPLLRREPDELRAQICVGPAEHCAELISRYAGAGCGRVYLWPLRDEPRQIERLAAEVIPSVRGA
jgi:alkanesulfonate monooxygenase SsuD/methylene tetrahydromethanopterin reductase-like flavin-dependent oxidoreductase (luciferase family)